MNEECNHGKNPHTHGECAAADEQRQASDMASNEQQVDIALEEGAQQADDARQCQEISKLLDEANALAEKNKDLYMRAVADLDTYRRKVQREKAELAKFAQQPIIEELLPSLDHLEMAISAADGVPGGKDIAMGVQMVSSQIKKVLSNFGVEEISPLGKDFDPNTAEAVDRQPSDDLAENKVLKVVRTGYTLNGRLLRPASVVVSSGKAK